MLTKEMVNRCNGRGAFGGKMFPFGFLEPGPHEQVELVFLNDHIEWFEVHWFERRHQLCVLPPLVCRAHEAGIPTVPSGYIGAMNKATRTKGIVRLTTRMIEEEPRLKSSRSLRGSEFVYWREGNSNKGKKHLRITGALLDIGALPGAPDIVAFVLKTFGKQGQ